MTSYVTRKTPGDTAWFTRDRIPEEKYDKYFEHFDPDLFDAREWARQAKAAGMKYAVMTTKHHEGFCMWDTQYTDYKCTNTPAGRDLVREYVDAFRAEGLRIGFYYSLIDWHHPEFPIDHLHPRRDDENAEALNKTRDMHKYAEYMRNQVTELLTNYGKIDILWFDFSYSEVPADAKPWMKGKGKNDWEAEKLIALARRLQPGIIIDNRTEIEQDVWTPEQFQPTEWVKHPETGELVVWEACQTFSGSWGYYRDEQTWKNPEMLLRMLVNTVSLGGNLLMNVGPTSRGYFDARAQAALKVYADWMKFNSRSIYGCTMAEPEFVAPADCRYTQSTDGSRLYLHLFAYPFAHLQLKGLAGKVEYAQFLHDGSEILFTDGKMDHFGEGLPQNPDDLTLYLPPVKPSTLLPVVELFLKAEP